VRKVLVIGSNSFSGSSFIAYLLGEGVEVIGVSRSPEAAHVFLPYRWKAREGGFRFHQVDLNHDLDTLSAILDRTVCRRYLRAD
jgi:dTDP-glucose 4,6-dehydratase